MDAAPLQARKEDITLTETFEMPSSSQGHDEEMFVEGRGDLLMSQPRSQSQTPSKRSQSIEPEIGSFDSPGMLRDAGPELDLGLYDEPQPFSDSAVVPSMEGYEGEEDMGDMGDIGGMGSPMGDADLGGGEEVGLDISGGTPSPKRKRAPVVDEVTEIPSKLIREQLADTTNIRKDWVPLEAKNKSKKAKKAAALQKKDTVQVVKLAEVAIGAPTQASLPSKLVSLLSHNMSFGAERDLNLNLVSPTKKRRSLSPEQLREAMEQGIEGVEAFDASMSPMKGGFMAEEDAMPDMGDGIDDMMMPDMDDMGGEVDFSTPSDGGASVLGDSTQLMEDVPEDDEIEVAPSVDKKTGWSVRTKESLARLRKCLGEGEGEKVSFPEVVEATEKAQAPRRKAAQQFFEMLVLHTKSVISMEQKAPLEELMIGQGDKFNSIQEATY